MPLSEDPIIRFRQQANTRVPNVVTALQRIGKMVSPEVPHEDRQAVVAAIEAEWRKTRAALETGKHNSVGIVFTDVASEDPEPAQQAAAPADAKPAEPVAPAGPATPGIDPGNPTPFGG